jgi:DNA-binding NarL/FixJ family response regulator
LKRIRVLLADDHKLVRAGFRSLLQELPDVEIVGEAADGAEAIALALTCLPDVIFMDVAMKNSNGLEATTRLRELIPDIRIIILSMHSTNDYVQHALRAGAVGYILKDAAALELGLALDAAMRGDIYLSPAVSAQVVESYLQSESPVGEALLTARQKQILGMIAAGISTKEIAFQLELSVKTVETHRGQIMGRLGIRDIAGLVRYAIRTGLIRADA